MGADEILCPCCNMSKWNLPVPQKIFVRHGDFTISLHAMRQFYHRMVKQRPDLPPEKKDSIFWFYKKFKKYLGASEERERKNGVHQIINHNFQKARYFVNKYTNWVFVVDATNNTILTCYPYEKEKKLYATKK